MTGYITSPETQSTALKHRLSPESLRSRSRATSNLRYIDGRPRNISIAFRRIVASTCRVYKELVLLYNQYRMEYSPTPKRFSTWYDGFFYEKFIAPQSDRLQTLLTIFAKKGGTALDIGCGVGALSFKLATKCSKVVGVDLSQKMISHAERRKLKLGATNVDFVCADAASLATLFPHKFDIATLVLFLHEIDGVIRQRVVESLLSMSDRLIIADFSSPFPRSVSARRLKMQEFIAGKRHYRNFKNWMQNGAIDGFVDSMNLQVRKSIPWENEAGKVVIVAS